jgi:hypothetical protein
MFWLVVEGEVEPEEIQGPSRLMVVKLLGDAEILEVLVISPNLYGVSHTFQVVVPLL